MKRKARIYKYRCDACGWEALRGEIIQAKVCSKCGSTEPPFITTEDTMYEVEKDTILKAKIYAERLIDGEDPEKLDKELWGDSPEEKAKIVSIFRPVVGSFYGRVHSVGGPDENIY